MLGRHALAVLGDLDRHARSLAAKPVSASCWRVDDLLLADCWRGDQLLAALGATKDLT